RGWPWRRRVARPTRLSAVPRPPRFPPGEPGPPRISRARRREARRRRSAIGRVAERERDPEQREFFEARRIDHVFEFTDESIAVQRTVDAIGEPGAAHVVAIQRVVARKQREPVAPGGTAEIVL